MKKIISILLVMLALVCCLASCKDNDSDSSGAGSNNTTNGTHTHSYAEWETVKNATCTTEGTKERYCACGEKQTATISMVAHTYGDWKIVKEATHSEKGSEERSCVCGERETRDIEIIPLVTTITEGEWKNAFDVSKYSSITVVGTVNGSEDGVDFAHDTVIKYYGRLLFTTTSGVVDLLEATTISYEEVILESFYDLGLSSIERLLSDYRELNDFGYSKITYIESEKCYQAVSEYGEIHKFWFADGKLKEYSYEDNGQEEYMTCSYTFINVNTTEKFSIPAETIRNEYQQIVDTITSDTKFYYYGENWERVYVSASEIKAILNSAKIEIIESYQKNISNGETLGFSLTTSTMSSEDPAITLSMYDGKLSSVKIGYFYDGDVYYYVEN